jgi:prepilin-type N-terminal cleavage/methylation domain-containing protein
MTGNRCKSGFTLIELLVALAVTSIVVTAVVTLSYALETANDFTDDTSQVQAQIRFAALRVSDLIRYSRLVCYAGSDDLALWRADHDNDGKISISELVYIDCGPAHDYLRLCKFPSANTTAIDPGSVGAFAAGWWSAYSGSVDYTVLVPQCSNVDFGFLPDLPPQSKFVTVTYDVVENGVTRRCQINAELRGRAGNLLDDSGNIVSDDD